MAIAVTLEAQWARTSGSAATTSAAFDIGDNTLLAYCVSIDTAIDWNDPPTNNGAALTWTKAPGSQGNPGVAVWLTKVATARTGMTVTIPAQAAKAWAHLYSVTGHDLTDHLGGSGGASNVGTNNLTASVTIESATGSYLLVIDNEYNELGPVTSSDLTYTQLNGGSGYAGWTDGLTGYKSLANGTTSSSFNSDAGGTGTAWHTYSWVQILAAAGSSPQTWTGSAATVTAAATSGSFVAGTASWTGSAASVSASAASGSFTPGAVTWTGNAASVSASASSGSFTAGAVAWTGSAAAVTVSATSGSFSEDAAPQTWTGSAATVTTTGTSGAFTAGEVSWSGSAATVTVAATSGTFTAGTVAWAASSPTVTVTGTSGTWTAGAVTWTGNAATVTVTGTSGSFAEQTADPNPITVTVRDRGHTATVSDSRLHTATIRARGHMSTVRENR